MSVDTYNVAGTYTWTAPSDGTVFAQAWGAGGSGAAATVAGKKAGGGGGAYSELASLAVTVGEQLKITVPATTANGGTPAFALVTNADATVIHVKAQSGNSPAANGLVGAAGGDAATGVGNSNYSGGNGGNGGGANFGGSGGSSAGTASNGTDGIVNSNATVVAPIGGGNGGGGGSSISGTSGSAPGGAAGGSGKVATNRPAAPGASGQVIITFTPDAVSYSGSCMPLMGVA